MSAFYYLSNCVFMQVLGVLAILAFFLSLWSGIKAIVLNRRAFQSLEFSLVPMLKKRKLLGFFREHAESAEDRVFAVINAYFTLIFLLSITIHLWWICIAAFLFSFTSLYELRRSWPGYALILGASNQESTKRLAIAVQQCVSPLFTTNMLNFVAHSEIEHELFKATSYRLKNEVISWKSAVEVHGTFARVIVLDASHITDGVLEELQLICDCEFWYKLLLLCPTDQSRAAASKLLSSRPDTLVVERQEQVMSILKALLQQFPKCRTSAHSLKSMLASSRDGAPTNL